MVAGVREFLFRLDQLECQDVCAWLCWGVVASIVGAGRFTLSIVIAFLCMGSRVVAFASLSRLSCSLFYVYESELTCGCFVVCGMYVWV